MSATGAAGRLAPYTPPRRAAPLETVRTAPSALDAPVRSLAAFFALAAFATLQYATLLVHPPALRVLGVAASATAAGALLIGSARLRVPSAEPRLERALIAALRIAIVLAALLLGLLAIGFPAHLLVPGGWSRLASDVHHGYTGLEGWLWPYRGTQRFSRETVLLVLPPALVLASAVRFWPARAHTRARGLAALGLLVTVLLAGVVNQAAPAWRVQGVLLLALLAGWLWLSRLDGGAVNRAAVWLGVCGLGALLLAPLVASRAPWIDYHAWDPLPATAAFDWDQTYGPIPWSRSSATVLTVAASRPELLRVTSLDRFDGIRFLRSAAPPGVAALDFPGAAARTGGAGLRNATITIAGLRSGDLVSGGGLPIHLRWLRGTWPSVARASDGTIALASTPGGGARYSVSSYAPTPPPSQLRAAPRAFPAAYLPYASFELPGTGDSGLTTPSPSVEASSAVPASAIVGAAAPGRTPASEPAIARRIERSPYGPTFALARRLAAGHGDSYDVALSIERYLLVHYPYNEHPPPARYPLQAFLFGSAGGYCQQFSGAMTLMLRMDGIPARVAAGFRPSAFDGASGEWDVSALDAHSWVEVFFSGVGWVSFDPTPPRTGSVSLGGAAAAVRHPGGSGPAARAGRHLASLPSAASGAARRGAGGLGGGAWAAIGAALIALGLATTRVWLTGRRRLSEALRGEADGAVSELYAALARTGHPLPATTTLRQLEARLRSSRARAACTYVQLLRAARYGAVPERAPTPRERRQCRQALASGGGVRGRVRALLALPPGVARRA